MRGYWLAAISALSRATMLQAVSSSYHFCMGKKKGKVDEGHTNCTFQGWHHNKAIVLRIGGILQDSEIARQKARQFGISSTWESNRFNVIKRFIANLAVVKVVKLNPVVPSVRDSEQL